MNEKKSVSELFVQHRAEILRYILKLTKDKELAEDFTQDLFLKFADEAFVKKYNEQEKFLPFATRTAHNFIVDYWRVNNRKAKPVRNDDDGEIPEYIKLADTNVGDAIEKEAALSEAESLVQYLPEKQQRIIQTRLYENKSFKTISQENNESINTSLGTMRYALINLRKLKAKKSIRKFKSFNSPKSKNFLQMSDSTDNNIQQLRSHLFEAIRKLESGTMKADEAKSMASLAQTIINSAKLELEYKQLIEKQPNIKMLNESQ